MPQTPRKKKPFTITLEVNDKTIKSSGNTILECIDALEPIDPHTLTYFTATNGKMEIKRYLNIWQLRRIFTNKLRKAMFAKTISLGF